MNLNPAQIIINAWFDTQGGAKTVQTEQLFFLLLIYQTVI